MRDLGGVLEGAMGGATGEQRIRAERTWGLVLSGGRETPLVENRGVSFLGMLTPRVRST